METPPLSQQPEYTVEQLTAHVAALKGDIIMLDEALVHIQKSRESTLLKIGLYGAEIERTRKEIKALESQWAMEAVEK
jgi:peptidoglycan hydrolase CwlO-like protein